MANRFLFSILIFLVSIIFFSCIQQNETPFAESDGTTTIYVDPAVDPLILWAAEDFSNDLAVITGRPVKVVTANQSANAAGIFIGHFQDALIKDLDVLGQEKLAGEWENFGLVQSGKRLIIAGSDIRGTVYGVFELAERLGISPWKWWADVTPTFKEKIDLDIPEQGIYQSPSVKFRGIFLNDEDWGLQPWAAKTFEPEVGDIGPKTYEQIFQLLLRLKANTIWPAMHPSTKAFFAIPGNKEMAEKYHINIGTSHAEPMLRNNVDEWDHDAMGDYNYFNNSEGVKAYWQERITETKTTDAIVTVGMRGIHDSGMEGSATIEERVAMLEKIIEDQREMLSNTWGKSANEIPQAFIPYKEVLEIYNHGMNLPDDITLMWTDDNYGYIRHFSNEEEQKRAGGAGVYYHLSYWGRPHDYLWLSSTQPGLIWYEMNRAYANGAHDIWIANVGDIKPAEYNMEFFLDMAWNINGVTESTIQSHLNAWSAREFGDENADEIADIMSEYYRLALLRKPEYMGWSQTEPTTQTRPSGFSNTLGELDSRIDAYQKLYDDVNELKKNISVEKINAFFQLVEYPVKGAAMMNAKCLFYQKACESGDSTLAQAWVNTSQQAFEEIKSLTEKYNNIGEGKWKEMMVMNPRNLPVFAMPSYTCSVSDSVVESSTDPFFIQGDEFAARVDQEGCRWKTIAGMGYSGNAISLFPLTTYKFENEWPSLWYDFEVNEPGNYIIEIRCLPTHANDLDQQVQVSCDNSKPDSYLISTQGRSSIWKENVLRNYASVQHKVEFSEAGTHKLQIAVNQTGIVIDQIAVIPEGYPAFYEIPMK